MKLNICHLYPDMLNLYGDRGNIICMEKRLQWRGIDVVTTGVSVGQPLKASEFDLFFLGGGQDFEKDVLLSDLAGEKTAELKTAIEDGKTVLAVCAGYQMLGQYCKTVDGEQIDLMGALDLYTEIGEKRMIGDYIFTCDDLGINVVGFENHSAKTYLGSSVRPMGKVLAGHGNNGSDGNEGARYKNVFATYAHGCLLPKNPILCDHILQTALNRKYGDVQLAPLNDALELQAHSYMEHRLLKK